MIPAPTVVALPRLANVLDAEGDADVDSPLPSRPDEGTERWVILDWEMRWHVLEKKCC